MLASDKLFTIAKQPFVTLVLLHRERHPVQDMRRGRRQSEVIVDKGAGEASTRIAGMHRLTFGCTYQNDLDDKIGSE